MTSCRWPCSACTAASASSAATRSASRLADADEDPARERDPQLAGRADRLQPRARGAWSASPGGRRGRGDRLEHQPLRGGDLAQAREVVARPGRRGSCAAAGRAPAPARRPRRRRRRSPSKPQLGEPLAHARVIVGRSPVRTSSSLTRRRAASSSSAVDLVGLVQVRAVRRERAVLAEAPARPRERQRDVAREGDAAAHPLDPRRGCAGSRRRLYAARADGPTPARLLAFALAAALLAARLRAAAGDRPDASAKLVLDFQPNAVHAGIYLALERDFDGAEGVDLSVAAPSSSTDSVKLLLARARAVRDPRHPRPGARPREGARHRRRHGPRPAPAGRRHRPAAARAAARPRGQARRGDRPALRRRRAAARSCAATAATRPRSSKVTIGFQAVTALLVPPRRRGHGLLERRGRGPAGQAPRHAPVQGRRLRRAALPRARAVREPPDARRGARPGGGHRPRPAPRLRGGDQRPGVGGRGARRSGARRPRRRARELDAVSPAFTEGVTRYGELDPRRSPPGRAGRRASASRSARPTSRAPSPPASSSGGARGRRRPCRRRAGGGRAPRRDRRAAASRPRSAPRALRAPGPSARW